MKKKNSLLVLAFIIPFVLTNVRCTETKTKTTETDNVVNTTGVSNVANTTQNAANTTVQNVEASISDDGIVTFGAIPCTEKEFDALQAKLGTTPEGCIALQLIAMQMFQNNPKVGEACLIKNNTETNMPSLQRRLPEIFRESDTYYARMHLVATYFNGATVENGFNPDFPYAITVRKNASMEDYKSQSLKGYVKYYQVYSEGYDTHWRGIEVVQQKGDPYYRVSSCSSVYVQCKEVDWEAEDEYHGLKTTCD